MGRIEIDEQVGIVVVTMVGRLSPELVDDMRQRLLPLLATRTDARILYDSRKVELTDNRQAIKALQAFNEETSQYVAKIASVTSDYTFAAPIGQIHVHSSQHERFFDFDAAEQWLRMV